MQINITCPLSPVMDVARAFLNNLQLCVNECNCLEQQKKHYGLFLVKALLANSVRTCGDVAILHCNLVRHIQLKGIARQCYWTALTKPCPNEIGPGSARLVPFTTPLLLALQHVLVYSTARTIIKSILYLLSLKNTVLKDA